MRIPASLLDGIFLISGFFALKGLGVAHLPFTVSAILCALRSDSFVHRVFKSPILVWVGIRCYFIYIVHILLLSKTKIFYDYLLSVKGNTVPEELVYLLYGVLVFLTLALLADLSFRFFERPIINFGEKLTSKASSVGPQFEI
jgi:peptidoglycan/LPS O-acetylase OafA/YrhL